jgi:GNAT superfamily N-acetyltransferase
MAGIPCSKPEESGVLDVSLEIRLAGPSDLPAVLSILNDAAAWLVAKGIKGQWPEVWDEEYVAGKIAGGETYLAYQNEQPVATVALQWSDEIMWGKQSDEAGYVHHLAVRRSQAGSGLGRQVLDWTAGQAIFRGKKYLRLDCASFNPALRDYYLRAGFSLVGAKKGLWEGFPFDVNLFEMKLN